MAELAGKANGFFDKPLLRPKKAPVSGGFRTPPSTRIERIISGSRPFINKKLMATKRTILEMGPFEKTWRRWSLSATKTPSFQMVRDPGPTIQNFKRWGDRPFSTVLLLAGHDGNYKTRLLASRPGRRCWWDVSAFFTKSPSQARRQDGTRPSWIGGKKSATKCFCLSSARREH